MSEDRFDFSNIFGKNKERKAKNASLKAAKESVLLFVSSEKQVPLSTFYADSPSVFDLKILRQGSIFRVEGRTTNLNSPIYHWFVSGGQDGTQSYIYEIVDGIKSNPRFGFDEALKISSAWRMRGIHPRSESFEIKLALQTLLGVTGPTVENTFPTTKIDIMSGGSAEKKPRNEKNMLKELVPARQEVENR